MNIRPPRLGGSFSPVMEGVEWPESVVRVQH
jgi:hypothetical protein